MVDVISIDGPSGSGKSTTARGVAAALGVACLESGGLYRAITAEVLRTAISPLDGPAISLMLDHTELQVAAGRAILNGADVTKSLRDPAVTNSVGMVAGHPEVRDFVTAFVRAWAERQVPLCVVEGRDIGSAVFPDALLKVYLHADPVVRADREAGALGLDGAQRLAQVSQRDELDQTRIHGPLVQTSDMYGIDTTHITADQVVAQILDRLAQVWPIS
jgi:cytidylate kinase